MMRSLVSVVAACLALLCLLWFFQRRLIYLPLGGAVPAAAQVIDSARDVTLETDDGLELGAWFSPGDANGPVVLVANGNAGNRSMRAPLARALNERGLGVLLFDYRGFGGNPGRPTEEGLALDARAALEFLRMEAGLAAEQIIYFGESLGSAVVTELATAHPPAALVLRSPFVDLAAVGRIHYPFLPVRTLLRDRYPLAEQLERVDAPVTVVFGSEDSIIPPSQSIRVGEAARDVSLVEVAGAGHNDRALLDGRALIDAIEESAGRAGIAPR